MTTTFRFALTGALAATVLSTASADIRRTMDVVPSSSILVMTMDSPRAFLGELESTPFGRILELDEIQEPMRQMMSQVSAGLGQALGEDDVDLRSMAPRGTMAMSIYPVVDEDTRSVLPGLIFVADFGEDADRMHTRMMTLLEDGPELDEMDVAGRTVTELTMTPERDEDPMGRGGMMGMPDPEQLATDAFGTMYMVREGSHLVLTSDLGSLRRMFDLSDGNEVDLLSDRRDVQKINGILGERDLSVMFLLRDMTTMIGAVDQMGMSAMITPLLTQFIGRIDSFAYGTSVDPSTQVTGGRMFISMPDGKAGFTRLFDTNDTTMEVPSFVPADAISYSQMAIDFGGIAPLIGRMARTAAMFGAPVGDPAMIQQIEEQINQFTDTLGQRVHQVQFAAGGDGAAPGGVMVMETSDTRTLDTLIGQYGAMMGMEGRDFAGQRIYAMDMAGMMGGMPGGGMGGAEVPAYAFGIGGGSAFIGQQAAVERMLRSIGDDGRERFSGAERAMQGAARLAGDGQVIGWGWSNTPQVIASQLSGARAQMEQMAEMMPPGEEGAAQFNMMMRIMNAVDEDMLSSIFGDGSWVARSTREGFVFDAIQTAPAGGMVEDF